MGTFAATRYLNRGEAEIAHGDLQATASNSTILLAPLTYTAAAARVLVFGEGVCGFSVRTRGDYTTHTTSPQVYIYRIYRTSGNVKIEAGATSVASDGTFLAVPVLGVASTYAHVLDTTVSSAEKDTTYKYSPFTSPTVRNDSNRLDYVFLDSGDSEVNLSAFSYSNMIERRSAYAMLVLASTAGAVSGGADTLEAQVLAF